MQITNTKARLRQLDWPKSQVAESYIVPAVVFLTITLFAIYASRNIVGPSYQTDEGAYLANALALTGQIVDAANSWHAGYSILILPAFLLADNPESIFWYVKVTNAIFTGLSAVIVYGLLKNVFSPEQPVLAAGAATLAALYPTYIISSGSAFATSAIVLFFSSSVYLCAAVNRWGGVYWPLWGAVVGFLYWIHPTGLGVVFASLAVAGYIAWTRREFGWFLVMANLSLSLCAVYAFIVEPSLQGLMLKGDFHPSFHYQEKLNSIWPSLRHGDFYANAAVVFVGQFFYLLVATYGFVLFGLLSRKSVDRGETVVLSYALLSLIAVAGIAAISFSSSGSVNPTTRVYGRYVDGVMLPLLAVGILFYSDRRLRLAFFMTALLGLAFIFLLYMTGNETTDSLGPFMLLGAWQAQLTPYVRPNHYPLTMFVWLCTALAFMGLAAAIQTRALVFTLLLLSFVVTIGIQASWRGENQLRNVQSELAFANIVKGAVPSGGCILFDAEGSKMKDSPDVYSFYFVDYEFRKLRLERWGRECKGAILSTRADLDKSVGNLVPIAANRDDGLIAWIDRTTVPACGPERCPAKPLSCIPNHCVEANDFTAADQKKVGVLDRGALVSDGREGLLFYGRYTPLEAGTYELRVFGSADVIDAAWVDVVSGAGNEQHGKFELPSSNTGGILLKAPVTLERAVSDLEVRIHVGENDRLRVTGFELRN